jgi:hypothetical protein
MALPNASAYYDPGVQRWINRDPINERGFMRATVTKGGDAEDDLTLYTFVGNKPTYRIDRYGLSIWYCTRTTDWGIGRHGYLWDDRSNPKGGHSCGQEGAWGLGNTSSPTDTGPGTKDGDTSCSKVPDSDGDESWIMTYCRKHINDQKLWWPGNDCHTAAKRILDDLGFQPPLIQRWNPGEQMFWYYIHTRIYGPI